MPAKKSSFIVPRPQRRQGERRNRRSFSTLSAGVYTTTWLLMVTLSPPAAVSKHEFIYRNKNTLSFVMVYSALFNNVFKALSLFFNKYLAEIQLSCNGICMAALHTREVLQRVLTWLGICD
jgi:hypothetical protein